MIKHPTIRSIKAGQTIYTVQLSQDWVPVVVPMYIINETKALAIITSIRNKKNVFYSKRRALSRIKSLNSMLHNK